MGCGFRWRRFGCTSAGATFEMSFEETGVETDGEVLEFEVCLGFADWGDLVLKLILQVEIKLIAEGLIVPVHILFLGLEFCRVLRCETGLVQAADFSYCGGFQVWIPIDSHEGSCECFERCEL